MGSDTAASQQGTQAHSLHLHHRYFSILDLYLVKMMLYPLMTKINWSVCQTNRVEQNTPQRWEIWKFLISSLFPGHQPCYSWHSFFSRQRITTKEQAKISFQNLESKYRLSPEVIYLWLHKTITNTMTVLSQQLILILTFRECILLYQYIPFYISAYIKTNMSENKTAEYSG